jgi:hypothetical protein
VLLSGSAARQPVRVGKPNCEQLGAGERRGSAAAAFGCQHEASQVRSDDRCPDRFDGDTDGMTEGERVHDRVARVARVTSTGVI